jgi:hypothetical protein
VRRRLTGAAEIDSDYGLAFPQVNPLSWAWLDLNQRPHPYQLNAGNRCADRRFCWSRPTVSAIVMRSIGGSVWVHPVLRSTHAWLILAFGITSYILFSERPSICRLIILISKVQRLRCPSRGLVLRDKECGEAAQAPERSRFNGSKRKVQVCGYL